MAKKKRADGRKEGKYTFNGKRYSIYGNTKTERDAKWEEKKKELESHRYKKDQELTVSEYFERWLANRKKVKSATVRTYGKLMRRICNTQLYGNQKFGEIKIVDLEPQNCKDLQNALRHELTTRTTNDSMSLLKKCMQTAVDEDAIKKNPCRTIERLPREELQARDTVHRCLTRTEVDTFMEYAKGSWYFNLYNLLLFSGLRIGEASALTSADVKGDDIMVNKTVVRSEIGYEIAHWTKTEAGRRAVPMHPNARKAIEAQKKINAMLREENTVVNMDEPIFKMPKGSIIRPDRVNAEINRICKEADIEKFTCHAFRATFISRCVADGMPVKDLMEISGHKDVKMTLGLYAHNDQEQTRTRLLAENF